METRVLNLKDQNLYSDHIAKAACALRKGKLVAFPTETVYGLGVCRDHTKAVERIYKLKKRVEEKRLTLMIADADDVKKYVDHFSSTARKLMKFFWPGPLAIIFPLKNGTDIGIRFPDDTAARDLIRTAKIPIVTTSANISGYPPSTDAQQVLMDFKGKIHVILDGGSTRFRSPSTVLKLKDEGFEIIRPGIISETMIRSCLENTFVRV
ncbi:Threonylcarbamoyl-AMP synthase [Candidatus Brocadiaceae bacterium B188]|nr:threonylcarbamoyl-AMP synthase [Candidatus Brocadia sapporoensis]QQR65662.1 MAG: threonylcarbamoyl-AMP synthase [Candidatus Brocadia sp.]RZV59837.1 MAG: threonylcarbamoyl-AMP synthase [Candidatus Brocadia sp. BROELEC01]TWU49974.1 Threonylcarbamoyl-AMP synthase [Candidatus Brocadiaceae bacterium B188]